MSSINQNLVERAGTEPLSTFKDGRAGAIYQKLYRRGVRPANRDEYESVCKICRLAAVDSLPECFVQSAAEAVLRRKPHSPVPYFLTVLHGECKQNGLFLYDMLARPMTQVNGKSKHGISQ